MPWVNPKPKYTRMCRYMRFQEQFARGNTVNNLKFRKQSALIWVISCSRGNFELNKFTDKENGFLNRKRC